MERLVDRRQSSSALLEVLRSSDETTAVTRYAPPSLSLPELEVLATLTWRMQSSFPNQEVTPEIAMLWRQDWTAIALQHGMAVLEEAVDLHRRSSSFLPSCRDMEIHVETVLERRRQRDSERRGRRVLAQMEEWKATWLREREEDRLAQQRMEANPAA